MILLTSGSFSTGPTNIKPVISPFTSRWSILFLAGVGYQSRTCIMVTYFHLSSSFQRSWLFLKISFADTYRSVVILERSTPAPLMHQIPMTWTHSWRCCLLQRAWSLLYNFIHSLNPASQLWENDLQCVLTDDVWDVCLWLVHSSSMSAGMGCYNVRFFIAVFLLRCDCIKCMVMLTLFVIDVASSQLSISICFGCVLSWIPFGWRSLILFRRSPQFLSPYLRSLPCLESPPYLLYHAERRS